MLMQTQTHTSHVSFWNLGVTKGNKKNSLSFSIWSHKQSNKLLVTDVINA